MSTAQDRPGFSNVSNKRRLSIKVMHEHLVQLTDGWPKNIGGILFGRIKEKLVPLKTAAALFAWIDEHAEVEWSHAGVTKEEFLEGLDKRAESFDSTSEHPHFPPVKGVFYTRTIPKAKKTGKLDKFIDFFSPATPKDRELLKAAALTLFAGLEAGQRPGFVFTSDPNGDKQRGVGVGKTTAAQMLSRLVGGAISVRTYGDQERALSGLLSPSALKKWVVLMDNVKTHRLSSEAFEAWITADEINGHRLHQGHASRPNLLTWFITVNGPSFSKDMAQRVVVIHLARPKASVTWFRKVSAFIQTNRQAIMADIRWHLESPSKPIGTPDRWADWDEAVLAKLKKPKELLKLIHQRRGGIDEDDQNTEDTIDHIKACLKARYPGTDPDKSRFLIPVGQLVEWVRQMKRDMSDRKITQYLKMLQSPRLKYMRTNDMRAYLWQGSKAKALSPTITVIYKVQVTR